MVSSLRVTALKKAFRPNQMNLHAGRNPTVMVNGVIFPLSQAEYLNLANYVHRQERVLNRLRNEENNRRNASRGLTNAQKMSRRSLDPTNAEYRTILRRIFGNVHTMMRPFPRGRGISAANPLWRRTNILNRGTFESFNENELSNQQRRYRNLFMNTNLIHVGVNKRRRILNILSNENLPRNAAINAAYAEYYARNPRHRNV